MEQEKMCIGCKKVKTFEMFHKKASTRDVHDERCKFCRAELRKKIRDSGNRKNYNKMAAVDRFVRYIASVT